MAGQLDHSQEAKQTEHTKVVCSQQAQQGRQYRHEIDQGEKAPHVAQPAPDRMGELPTTEIDDGPEAKDIFHGKHRGCRVFCDRKSHRIAVANRLDGLKHHSDDIGDDEGGQQQVEEAGRLVGMRRIIVKPTT
jgi:hypothetical protein